MIYFKYFNFLLFVYKDLFFNQIKQKSKGLEDITIIKIS
ncbi:hypothetical protein BBG19_1658 [Francisella sp. MA067296]|nr:hypothetical protein BBG19_1658 [Francisella sp. MA067296]